MAAVEIAEAYLALYAKMPGVGKDIGTALEGSEVTGAVDGAATHVGGRFGAGFGKALGAAALVAGVVGAFKGLYEVGETFDNVSDTIRIKTGATGDALQGLSDIAVDIAKTIPTSFEDAGETVATLSTRMGIGGDTLETVASQFLEAGRILGEDIDIDTATGALNAFHIEGDAVSGSLDFLFQQSQISGIGMNDLISKVQAAAPITQQLGFSFEDTAGMIASFDKAGLDSQGMIGAMQRGLAKMVKPGEDAQDTFKRVVDQIQGFIDTGDDAAARDLAGQVFGTRGAAQFVGALQSGALNMDDLSNSAALTGDTILGASGDTQDFAEKWQVVQNNATAALQPLGSAVFGAIADAVTALMPGLAAFGTWLSDNTWAIPAFIGLIGAVTVAWIAYSIAQWAVNAATMAFPLTPIILGILLLIAAIVALVVNWDAVVKFLTDVWNGFIGWITGVLTGFAGWWNDLWAGFGKWVTDVWNGFVGWIQDIWNGFVSWILGVMVGYIAWWNGIWQGISDFISGIWDGIVSFVSDAINNVWGFISDVGTSIAHTWNNIWDGISSVIRDIWNNIVGFIEGGVNGAIDLINGLTGGMRDVLAVVGIEIGPIPHIHIPRLAAGAIIEHSPGGTLATIGEGRYDEAVVPLGGPQLDEFAESLVNRMNGGTDSVSLDDSTMEAFTDKLASKIVRAFRGQDRMGFTGNA